MVSDKTFFQVEFIIMSDWWLCISRLVLKWNFFGIFVMVYGPYDIKGKRRMRGELLGVMRNSNVPITGTPHTYRF